MKVLFMTNAPASYRVDFFNCLGRFCDLTVLFESKHDKSRNRKWESDKFDNFKAIFLKGIKCGDADALCPSIIKYLDQNYDVIVVGAYHTPTGMLAIQYLKLRKKNFIISSDGGIIKNDSKVTYAVKRYLISSAKYWLSTGTETNRYLIHYGAKNERIFIYPFTSICTDNLLKSAPTFETRKIHKKKLGIKYNKTIIAVGQFIHRKGFDVLLRSIMYIKGDVGIYIIGGKETSEYREIKERDKLTNVHFVDFLGKEELGEYYQASDLFVLPTREDIWGLVVNEAMAYGIPVITTNKCGAGLEMVHNGENGFIIEVENYYELADRCNRILAENSGQMSNNALNTAREYTIEKMASVHYNIFQKIKELEA